MLYTGQDSIRHVKGWLIFMLKSNQLLDGIKKIKRLRQINWLHSAFSRFLVRSPMKLTIIRLFEFSAQDKIDLGKIWPEYSSDSLMVSDKERIYAAKFNERLLGAVRVTLTGDAGALDSLRVREMTRRRGVGQYLLEDVMRDNPDIARWWLADVGIEDSAAMTAFMQASGFREQPGGWAK